MRANQSSRKDVPAASRVIEDVDAMARVIADGVRCDYVQLESTPFRARWSIVHFDPFVLQFGSEEIAVFRRLRIPADRWALMIPLDVPEPARWNGHRLRHDDLMVCPPRSECLAFDPSSTRFAILTAHTASAIAEAALPFCAIRGSGPVAVACGPDIATLRDGLISVREQVEASARSPKAGAAFLEQAVIECLHQAGATRADAVMIGDRSRIVSRAEAFFRCHMSEGVSVAELSNVAGVSERSLRNAFYDVYTTSPKRYMKLWQLHQVRRALRAGTCAATVTDVATDNGFYELGRFAGAYKSLFGEAPSETLRKARHQQLSRGAA